MLSIDGRRALRHRMQSGQSLVEALVASAIVGLTVVGGLVALDETVIGARQVSHQAWGECMQRGVIEAVLATPWSDAGRYPAPAHITISAASLVGQGPQRIQQVTVAVSDPDSGSQIARVPPVSFYKAWVLAPSVNAQVDVAAVTNGCKSLIQRTP
jgi:hypothetical protein